MKLYLLLAIIILLPSVYGDVLIEQIYYDLPGADDDLEFVDIKNYGLEAAYICDLTLFDEADLVWNGSTENSCYLLANESFRISAPGLPNTKGAIFLNGSFTDLVGYGTSEIYLGSPAMDVTEGHTLLRVNFTGDNSIDFVSSEISNLTDATLVTEITIENVAPELHSAKIYKQGESFFVDGDASDANGMEDIISYSYYLGDSLYQNDSSLSGIIPFNGGISELPITNPQSELSLAVIDSFGELSDFLLIPIFTSLFEITSIKPISLQPGESGFLEVDLLAGKDATYTIILDSLYGKEEISLNSSFTADLVEGENGTLQLPLSIPLGISAGEYKGSLEIIIE